MPPEFHGVTTLKAIFGGMLAYRDLVPVDRRLPGGPELRAGLGAAGQWMPRKTDPACGPIVAELLRRARKLTPAAPPLRRLVYLGDSRPSDGAAFTAICAAGGWPGRLFIGQDDLSEPPRLEWLEPRCLANRWALLGEFIDQLEATRFLLDAQTAVVIDVDKTILGARGRNDFAIDGAREEALVRTAAAVVGGRYDEERFLAAYRVLRQPMFHPFTGDNHDLLAYLCLVISTGLIQLDKLLSHLEQHRVESFDQLLRSLSARGRQLADAGLAAVHADFQHAFLAGDPTPFKLFRQNEFLATAARLSFPAGIGAAALVRDHLVITEEVATAAKRLQTAGVLVFGLSDKPVEASWPPPGTTGRPLHELPAGVVGIPATG